MKATRGAWIERSSTIAIVLALAVAGAWLVRPVAAQRAGATGTIAGRVTATQGGEVRGLRVKATDAAHKIAYTVFTQKGQYHVYNLPPATYSVQVMEEEWQSSPQTVTVTAGQTQTADVSVTPRARSEGDMQRVDFDTLYVPGPGRDIFLKNCVGCHGLPVEGGFRATSVYTIKGMTEAGWRQAYTQKMKGNYSGSPMLPIIPQDRLTPQDEDTLIKWLAASFPNDGPRRSLKFPKIERDEPALARAMFIEYETPNGGHDVAPDPDSPGVVWFGGGQNTMARFDSHNPDPATRMKQFPIGDAKPGTNDMTAGGEPLSIHGIIALKGGKVWWTEYHTGKIDELDAKTGKVTKYLTKTPGAAHSITADTKGNIYWTYISGVGKIGRIDAKTKASTDLDLPIKGDNGYGIRADQQDRVWVAAPGNSPTVMMYDPATSGWKTFPVSSPPRRVVVDSTGKVGFCLYGANGLAIVDPERGKVTEHPMPLPYGNPYAVGIDAHDNMYLDNFNYNSLVKFDQRTNKYTYIPFPTVDSHAPLIELDPEGTVWYFSTGVPGFGEKNSSVNIFSSTKTIAYQRPIGRGVPAINTLVAFKPDGNVPPKGASQ